jgi:hypothetical protein
MEDFYQDGFNDGYGRKYLNREHDIPETDGDKYSYRCGQERGERWMHYKEEFDRDEFGDDE